MSINQSINQSIIQSVEIKLKNGNETRHLHLTQTIRRRFKRNRVMVGGIHQQWQMDLADMQSMQKFNDGYRYLLVCIDVFSKYAWVIPLKKKMGPSLVEAFILVSGRKPEKVMTDQGTEFFNGYFKALMKEKEIDLCNTYNETKTSIVERLIRTLKTKMWRSFTAKKTMRYIDVLPDLVYSCNHSVHRSIKMKPAQVTADNEKQVWHTLYDDRDTSKRPNYKFKIGDQGRISKIKRTFEKGYLPSFSKEIFTISKQIPRNPVVYKLKDYDGEELKRMFYDNELQKVIKQDDIYEVEKILKKRGRGNNVQCLVKWLGYPHKFNSWIPASETNKFKLWNVSFVFHFNLSFVMSGAHFYLTFPTTKRAVITSNYQRLLIYMVTGKLVCTPFPILTPGTLYGIMKIMFITARTEEVSFGLRPL